MGEISLKQVKHTSFKDWQLAETAISSCKKTSGFIGLSAQDQNVSEKFAPFSCSAFSKMRLHASSTAVKSVVQDGRA